MKLTFFVVSTPGLESVVLEEVKSLGYPRARIVEGGVSIHGTVRDLYRCNYLLRTASKIFLRIRECGVHQFKDVTNALQEIDLHQFADASTPIAVSATSHASTLYHTGGIEQAAREGIASQGLIPYTSAPESLSSPLMMKIRIVRNWCTISIDTSGDPLYQRGYKHMIGAAPLRETLAAAMLRVIRWTPDTPLVDPFCGAGTIPIEAALIARGIPPGSWRTFGFQRWPQFNRGAWSSIVGERSAATHTKDSQEIIEGLDSDENVILAALSNAEQADVLNSVCFTTRDAKDFIPPAPHSLIIGNPPYGDRLGNSQTVAELFHQFGKALHRQARGSALALILPAAAPTQALGLNLEERLTFLHGGKRVHLLYGVIP